MPGNVNFLGVIFTILEVGLKTVPVTPMLKDSQLLVGQHESLLMSEHFT